RPMDGRTEQPRLRSNRGSLPQSRSSQLVFCAAGAPSLPPTANRYPLALRATWVGSVLSPSAAELLVASETLAGCVDSACLGVGCERLSLSSPVGPGFADWALVAFLPVTSLMTGPKFRFRLSAMRTSTPWRFMITHC